ncbi:methyltransferase [Treponema bryantii]|uniref:methyltransferase n=1 Tax=Treponema bryantii TaxID=163 RepID=UPI0003B5C96A|nr:methyltransferase [Treponema bryantii]
MDKAYFDINKYKKDDLRAVDAKFEAQKIAFAPLAFQAIKAMINLGLLQAIEDAGDEGINRAALAEKCGVSEYGAGVLCEMALGMNVIKLTEDSESDPKSEKYKLGKTGWMLLEDDLTRVNFWFTNDICYQGAWDLEESVRKGKPEGLKVFGDKWVTVYEALSTLPDQPKKSWFEFDHFYSDIAFPEALPIVFAKKPKHILDIGGNTGKWSLTCCRYDPDVKMTICDLPGQANVAKQNAAEAGFADRVDFSMGNVLEESTKLPAAPDAVWMSQFLDCFSLHQVTKILRKVYEAATPETNVWVLEPLWDKQKFEASSYSLMGTSLYFTCIANGNSKMYRYQELVDAIEEAGFKLDCAHHNLGSNAYSLLCFRKK